MSVDPGKGQHYKDWDPDGFEDSALAQERPQVNQDVAPASTAPGPQTVPVRGFAPGSGVGRQEEFSAGQIASEMLGHRGSPAHNLSFDRDPEPGAHWQGQRVPTAIHRTDDTVPAPPELPLGR